MTSTPFIPDNAPFTPEQRGWLNGFLAGLFSGAEAGGIAATAPSTAALKVLVVHASQSGTAEGLARKVTKELKAKGFIPTLTSIDKMTPATLAQEQYALLIASTYGEGDPPDNAKTFFTELSSPDAPRLEKLSYSLLALGDKHYEHFCKFGTDLDQRMQELGAKPVHPCMLCDLDLDEPFAAWKSGAMAALSAAANGAATTQIATSAPTIAVETPSSSKYTRENPFLSPLVEKRPLTHAVSTKQTLHLAFCLKDADMTYEVGDACGVVAQNDPRLVGEVIEACGFTGSEPVKLDKGPSPAVSLTDALTHHLQITRLSRKLLSTYANKGECRTLLALLAPEEHAALETYLYERGLIDILIDCPGVLQHADDLVALLPKLAPRLYSISSSPSAHTAQVHTTVAVVRYRSNNRDRGGVCSTLFADRTEPGQRLPIYIHPNKRFRLPKDPDSPMIMIGPGTGIAPFRAFLHERRARGAKGRNWLFFGDRSATTDFLYREELESMQADGHLNRLDLAFSRDQERKIYVQDRMEEQGAEFWQWLEQGASVYVCGDASRMAKDVDATLRSVVAKHGQMDPETADDYVQQLADNNRYQRDVY